MKKLIAAIAALTIVAGAMPFEGGFVPEYSLTASAEEEYTEVTEGSLTFNVYLDHAVVSACDQSAEGEIVIPAEVNGVPVTSIREYAFYYCTSLTSITIPDSVTSIGEYALYGCSSLTSINVNSNNQYYSDIEGVLFNKDKTKIIRYPAKKNNEEYSIPDSVTSIGSDAFRNCLSLTSITIPDSVTSIDMSVFSGCSNLESVTIPDSVTNIDYGAFQDCTSLTSIIIPDSVTGISGSAFCGCSSLTSITIPESVEYLWAEVLSNCENLKSVTILNPDCEIDDSYSTINNGYDENGEPYFTGTIYGYEGSTAQAYAEKYGYKFEALSGEPTAIVYGDANGDGVTGKDALAIQKLTLQLIDTLPEE